MIKEITIDSKIQARKFCSRTAFALVAAMVMLYALAASSASAATTGPVWAIRTVARPTDFSIGGNALCVSRLEAPCDSYLVVVTNIGTTPTAGTVVVKDTLPAGLTVERVSLYQEAEHGYAMSCPKMTASPIQCEYSKPLAPGDALGIEIEVTVNGGGASSVTNAAIVEGGGAASQVTSQPSTVANAINGAAPSFGVQDFAVGVFGSGAGSDDQAGDHPSALTTSIDYNTGLNVNGNEPGRSFAVQEPRAEIVDLPLGFVGDPLAAEQCPESDMYGLPHQHCPPGSVVGEAILTQDSPPSLGIERSERIYNMVPEAGYPATFAFEVDSADAFLYARVLPSSAGYVLSVSVPEVPRVEGVKITGVSLTFFGDPAEQRGPRELEEKGLNPEDFEVAEFIKAAFFTNPTDCSAGPLKAKVEMDSWVDPARWVSKEATVYEASPTQALSGCDALQFNPTIELHPEETRADTPTGYEVDLKVPQTPNFSPDLATPDLKNAEVTLPEGVALSPGAADGLAGCQKTGPEGINIAEGWTPTGEQPLDPADPEAMEIGPDELPHIAPGHCPAASQIGTVEIATPLLANPLQGHVYLTQPLCGGAGEPACTEASASDGELFGIYLEAEGSGVIVKLKGNVQVNPQTGRVTTTFAENPQLPFSELKLKLNGGERAPLANPQTCGTYTTTSVLEPYSAPESGPAATPFSSFDVSGCAGAMPFAPGFLAQTSTPLAGAFTPFTLMFSRRDGEQDLSGIVVHTPTGLLGKVAGVPRCGEAQANAGTCGLESQIGTTTVASGSGSAPLYLTGGVYLTGPYNDQPFGLSIVVPAVAGPFKLGNVVVRASIAINPHTAAITTTSNPLPQIIDGVPTRIQAVNVTLNRPGFMFDPTNCDAQRVTATISSAQSASSNVSSPFGVAGCAGLPFKPSFSASTTGRASKTDGAALDVKVISKGGPQPGEEANVKSVKVDLPKQLPSRLTTLQKACTEAQFNANPAGCPKESDVGTASAITPILSHPLTGPAYFVSHGGEAFPDLEIVLQGEGITLILDGNTDIKKGITSSTFRTVPDAPISSFELKLPMGPYSILGTNLPASAKYSLCGQTLNMPTAITGQNGAVVKQTTKIGVEGCKPAIRVVRHSVKATKATVVVSVPTAGRLLATGKGVSTGRGKAGKAGNVSVKVTLTRAEQAFLRKHPGRKLKAKIKLRFTPRKGAKLTTSVTVLIA